MTHGIQQADKGSAGPEAEMRPQYMEWKDVERPAVQVLEAHQLANRLQQAVKAAAAVQVEILQACQLALSSHRLARELQPSNAGAGGPSAGAWTPSGCRGHHSLSHRDAMGLLAGPWTLTGCTRSCSHSSSDVAGLSN